MNTERIRELAEQAKAESNQWLGSKPAITVTHDELEKFAELIAAEEREACAKVCEEKKSRYEERASRSKKLRDIKPEVVAIAGMTCDFNAAAIRARGK